MYTCDYGLVRNITTGRYTKEDVSQSKVRELLSENDKVILVLLSGGNEYSLDLSEVEDRVYGSDPEITVAQWLIQLGNESLPTSDDIPTPTVDMVLYNDVWGSGYDVQAVHPYKGSGSDLADHELTDLRLTKDGVDYSRFHKRCLVTVSGLLHPVDFDDNGVLVKGGGRTCYLSRDNSVGILSFENVGEVKTILINDTLIAARTEVGYKEGIYVKLNESIGTRTVALSIGGYLHFNNQHYRVINDTTILIEWRSISVVRRYMETRGLIDLSSLEKAVSLNPRHSGSIDRDSLDEDAAILTYLTLLQSFVILIDSDNLFFEKRVLENSGLPGRYYSYTRPTQPMLTSNGLLPAYTAIPEHIAFTLCIPNNLVIDYASERTDQPYGYQNSAHVTHEKSRYGSAYLLEIGTERI